jgi:hypothetical protein
VEDTPLFREIFFGEMSQFMTVVVEVFFLCAPSLCLFLGISALAGLACSGGGNMLRKVKCLLGFHEAYVPTHVEKFTILTYEDTQIHVNILVCKYCWRLFSTKRKREE